MLSVFVLQFSLAEGPVYNVASGLGPRLESKSFSLSRGGGLPPACLNETKEYCADGRPDVMRCLANHSLDLSASCKAMVKKRLPGVCKAAIKKSCDLMEDGILPCLKRLHTAKQLTGTCKDTFLATTSSSSRQVKGGLGYVANREFATAKARVLKAATCISDCNAAILVEDFGKPRDRYGTGVNSNALLIKQAGLVVPALHRLEKSSGITGLNPNKRPK